MRQRQILVVEDNDLNRSILSDILSDDYEILEAENGQVALDILEQNRDSISLILLDIMMPVMDGYTFLDKIKKDEEFSLIPVIVMTQGNTEEDEVSALEHGATDFIPKPYRPQVIKHRVASLINLCETAAMVNQLKFDRLTGLYTSEYFYRKVRACLDENPQMEYTILCCNMENFKLYNDTFGREAGDRMLVKMAEIFSKRVGKDAICCRYRADRFLCLTDSQSERKRREWFLKSKELDRSEQLENISIKLGVYEIVDQSISVEQMCDRALLAVETITGKYDQHVAVYDDLIRSKLIREQTITDAMEIALHENQFDIYFQPKYSLGEDCIVGAEALVRWIHPEWGVISPKEFIPIFEKSGFIRWLDEYVWESACEKLRNWKEKGYLMIPISVNVSRADIYQSNLVDIFCNLIKKYGIDSSLLHLEITESAYTETPDQIISTTDKLHKHGFIVEMDDFGSGYSSFNMMGQLSLDILKLDMEFVHNEMEKAVGQSLLYDVINMAHKADLKVVAEGVETIEQKECLQRMGCDYAQGYLFAKPMPTAEFEELLKTQCV